MKTEVKKYIVEETMGDGTINIKVKFSYRFYIFGKLLYTKYKFDPIIFSNIEEAENYAKYVIAPSENITLSEARYYYNSYGYSYNDVQVYKVFTNYNGALVKIMHNYDDTIYPKPEPSDYHFLYVHGYCNPYAISFKNDNNYFSGFVLKNLLKETSLLHKYDYINEWEDITSEKSIKDKFDIFSKYINRQIKDFLNKETKKRLSKTLVSSNETLVDENEKVSYCSINTIISEYDASRNQIIKDELKRVSDYQNFLKKLIR